MLRVASVLYLERVWTCPTLVTIQSASPDNSTQSQRSREVTSEPYTIVREQSINEDELEPEILDELEQSILQVPSSQQEYQDFISIHSNQQHPTSILINGEVDHQSLSNSVHANDLFFEEQKEEGDQHPAIHDVQGDASTSDCTSSLHTGNSIPSRSETPMTIHEDLLSDEDKSSNKFSPKRILHRARSSITEESVRNLGRRTSLFLDKIASPPSSDFKTLRRQSSKLTDKGKSFTKKLKRVVSFHQNKQPQATF